MAENEVPKYLYLSTRVNKFRTYTTARLNNSDKEFSIEYILKSLADKKAGYFKNKAKFYKELTENIMDRYNRGGTMPVFTEIEEFENE